MINAASPITIGCGGVSSSSTTTSSSSLVDLLFSLKGEPRKAPPLPLPSPAASANSSSPPLDPFSTEEEELVSIPTPDARVEEESGVVW